jgi:hypothetical protein
MHTRKKERIVLVWTCCSKNIILVFGILYNIWNCTDILSAIRLYITRSGSLWYRLRIVLYGKWGVERWRASNSLYFALGIQTYQSFWNCLYFYKASQMKWCFTRGLVPQNWCVVAGNKAWTGYQWWNECDNVKGYKINFSLCLVDPHQAMNWCRAWTWHLQLLTRTQVLNTFLIWCGSLMFLPLYGTLRCFRSRSEVNVTTNTTNSYDLFCIDVFHAARRSSHDQPCI